MRRVPEPFLDYLGRNNDALAGGLAGGLIGTVLGALLGAGIGMADHAYVFTTMGAVGIGALVGFAAGAPLGSALGAAWRTHDDRFGDRLAAGLAVSYGLVALAVLIALGPALTDPAPLGNAFLTTAPAGIAAFLTPLVAPLPQLAF